MVQFEKKPVVYTAQSKVQFYCRSAVSAFVLQQGAVPLNPFMVFDYFLQENVARDLVRSGNNNLIRIADELWVFGDKLADGVFLEILLARALDKKVRYFTISPKVEDIKPIRMITALTLESEMRQRFKPLNKQQLLSLLTNEPIDLNSINALITDPVAFSNIMQPTLFPEEVG